MNDAAQRFNQRRFCCVQSGANRHGVNGRHGDKLSQSTRQSSDAMFAVKLALMRIAGLAVLTQRRAAFADAVQSLIDDDMVTDFQIRHLASLLCNMSVDLVSQNLRLHS